LDKACTEAGFFYVVTNYSIHNLNMCVWA
jgi:hypothetical protein